MLYVADSLENAKERMLAFCDTNMARPFRVRYNAFTHTVSTDRAVLRDAYMGGDAAAAAAGKEGDGY